MEEASSSSDEGTVREEISKLLAHSLKATLHATFPELEEHYVSQPVVRLCTKKQYYGDYKCDNAMSIWHTVREKEGKIPQHGPKAIAMILLDHFPETDLIEGTPCVHETGVVTLKISGGWIAKRLYKMLNDGIDTWSPKLPMKIVIVDFPLRHMDMEEIDDRSTYIRDTLTHMLNYSNVDVGCLKAYDDPSLMEKHMPSTMELPNKAENIDLLKDLGALRYGLMEQNADWIVYVTPFLQLEYIEECVTVARDADFISYELDKYPRASYAGCLPYSTEPVDTAKYLEFAELFKATEMLGYTAQSVLKCAIRYTHLKTHRMGSCTFDIKEMLNDKGNTVVYLLKTYDRISSISQKYHKDINELKASELISEKDEERELGLHLLRFSDAIKESCLNVLPHILCKYLYDLSQKFTSYCDSSVSKVGSAAETFRSLLCEATRLAMEKCFHLLGIIPEYLNESRKRPFGPIT